MNNLIQNYEKILDVINKTCSHIPSQYQIREPKLSDRELVALNLTAEYMSINTELQLFRTLSGTLLDGKIERSVYNKRRRNLFAYTEQIRQCLSDKFSHLTNVFIIDTLPVEICQPVRANRSAICSTDEINPTFGFCAARNHRYFGYKLHAVCDRNGVIHSFDFTPANVHDVNYLTDVKHSLKIAL